jgi:hypothetical protein
MPVMAPSPSFTKPELSVIQSALTRMWMEETEHVNELHERGEQRLASEVYQGLRVVESALDKLGGPLTRALPKAGMASGSKPKKEWPWLSLEDTLAFEPLARKKSISTKARSPSGFLTQFKRVNGDFRKLNDYWWGRRQDFVARHMQQAKNNREAFLKTGEMSPRHLALIMWAYSPVPKLAKSALRNQQRSTRR